ncbi:TonB-dependent receptor domain-containing protein [Brevundimonas sp.]|uniref:TonB-dependent receptor domain-containing protein n=1 Tax=Brevundimonas sp. TaxID=1871086 RepID=UPI002D6D2726|nr:TonB-dependent receptor [Brevundimonas sp.]HYC69228.1 TonB-dependent receptor [Brevundimonas sp.]
MLLKRKFLFGTTILAGVVAAAAPALAQDQLPGVNVQGQQGQEATQIEEVVITGSRIRRDPTNSPTPLISVSREQLLTTGQSTVIDYLATIPALSNSVVPSDTTGSGLGDGGLSLANLRSLGSNRTLTLVDGRRHVGSNGGSLAVDVDTIPRLLIENIEIVTGGASSVYGADAVSGVLNFVLRKDFEGVEIDANYGMINENGEASKRLSALIGHNFLDDRLNLYAHGEYEEVDQVTAFDVDWINDGYYLLGMDADPTNAAIGPTTDGTIDTHLFRSPVRMDRPRWGQTTVVHVTPLSPTNDPDVANFSGSSCIFTYAASCYAVAPGYTYWYDGTTARPANFGTRIGNTGVSRPYNYGGDGVNAANFSTLSIVPHSESARFQAGANIQITDNIRGFIEAKHVTEDTFDISQPTFFDFDLDNTSYSPDGLNSMWGVQSIDLRWDDNAFLPDLVKNAIATNVLYGCTAPTTTTPSDCSTPLGILQLARHTMFGPDRTQDNERVLNRYVAGLSGSFDRLGFVNNINWDIGYTYGEVEVENRERGVDSIRFGLAADSVIDTAGLVNGNPGEIVCRVQLLDAQGLPLEYENGIFAGEDIRTMQGYGQAAVDECVPLNIFGDGNQDPAALAYVDATIGVTERNEQEQLIASAAGELWDLWGAGPIGVALGVEHRREYTEGVGRDADTNGRFLFLNTGPDFPGAQYESDEAFAELSIPLFRDSWLGEYAELSGSYRYADYSTVGELDVYGINLVYRPIQDIAFKTSFNSSVRVPDLGENFSPFSQTFANGFTDPCSTTVIGNLTDNEVRDNRIANCSALAAQQGLSFDFGGATVTTTDDFLPNYTSGIAGVLGGNPLLRPETSESFTFSTVIQPRFFPNFSLVLDYYEIEIEDVIASVSAQTAANNCVSGTTLNTAACDTIFRNRSDPDEAFWVGGPVGDPIGGFIQGSINYAALTTRGLDFTARYSLDIEETFGRNLGRLDYSIGGLWLIEQEQFLNADDPEDGTELSSGTFYPRVRFTSSLTYTPNDTWSVNWTVDWQTSQDIVQLRNYVSNSDSRPVEYIETGNYARHDFTVRWNVRDDLSLRAGVVNAFDAEQAPWLGTAVFSNFDPYGTRYFIGLNYRPF